MSCTQPSTLTHPSPPPRPLRPLLSAPAAMQIPDIPDDKLKAADAQFDALFKQAEALEAASAKRVVELQKELDDIEKEKVGSGVILPRRKGWECGDCLLAELLLLGACNAPAHGACMPRNGGWKHPANACTAPMSQTSLLSLPPPHSPRRSALPPSLWMRSWRPTPSWRLRSTLRSPPSTSCPEQLQP